ncbi:MAG: NTP transferase domain-containing protein [Anaerolineales bacterium]|nr:NTP transferase domain-containing protein [Anaerolineales bacterium]
MQAVILAAGRGKRLHPVTANRTKAMAPILGQPIIWRVMQPLIEQGIQDFVIVTSPEDQELRSYCAGLPLPDVVVQLVTQPEPLGMGHALLQAAPYITGDFLLSSCDNLVAEADLARLLNLWRSSPNSRAILTALQVGPADLVRMGVLKLDGERVIGIVEKPTLETAPSRIGSIPLYIFSHQFLTYLAQIRPSPRGEYELQDAIQELIDRDGQVRALMLAERIDLTTPQDLLRINLKFLESEQPRHNMAREIGTGSRLVEPYFIQPEVVIRENCKIGPNVFIEKGAQLGDGVQIENCIVLRDRIVATQTKAFDQVIW